MYPYFNFKKKKIVSGRERGRDTLRGIHTAVGISKLRGCLLAIGQRRNEFLPAASAKFLGHLRLATDVTSRLKME